MTTWSKRSGPELGHVCRKLLLQPGDHLLAIGCGRGALVIHAATYYGVRAYRFTRSQQRRESARARIAQAGLQELVSVELRDHRDYSDYSDLPNGASYDRVASVGMFDDIRLKRTCRCISQRCMHCSSPAVCS